MPCPPPLPCHHTHWLFSGSVLPQWLSLTLTRNPSPSSGPYFSIPPPPRFIAQLLLKRLECWDGGRGYQDRGACWREQEGGTASHQRRQLHRLLQGCGPTGATRQKTYGRPLSVYADLTNFPMKASLLPNSQGTREARTPVRQNSGLVWGDFCLRCYTGGNRIWVRIQQDLVNSIFCSGTNLVGCSSVFPWRLRWILLWMRRVTLSHLPPTHHL